MFLGVSRDSWAEVSQNVQHFNKSMLPTNLISDDIGDVQQDWKLSGKVRQFYLETVSEYQSSPFPYRWNFATRWSIIPTDESMAARGNYIVWTPPDPSSFKSRFHKARVRWRMSRSLMLVESSVGSNFTGIYREWFDKISNRDERWSFLEYLEGLEMNDYRFGFDPWAAYTPMKQGDRDAFRNKSWTDWYDDLRLMSVREQAGIIEYPDLADRALEAPESLKRLMSSEDLPKDLEIALTQAWPSFRRNWPQTARCRVFSLHDSREALAKIKEWMETGLAIERLLLEDSGRSSLQEWLVGFVDL